MPGLQEDASAALMHMVGDLAPARDLFLGVDAWRVLIALALLRHLRGLGDQKAGRGALAIIFDGERTGHQPRQRPVAGQWRHHEAVRKGELAKLEAVKKSGRHVIYPERRKEEADGTWGLRQNLTIAQSIPITQTRSA